MIRNSFSEMARKLSPRFRAISDDNITATVSAAAMTYIRLSTLQSEELATGGIERLSLADGWCFNKAAAICDHEVGRLISRA